MGMRKKASLGGWCGGYTPLGYSYDNHTKILIPDIDERRVIEKIFYLYVVKRMGAKSIAVYLNRQGLRARSGRPFSTSLVLAIITNPFYLGKI
jgi:site-specific DNA recombinase